MTIAWGKARNRLLLEHFEVELMNKVNFTRMSGNEFQVFLKTESLNILQKIK